MTPVPGTLQSLRLLLGLALRRSVNRFTTHLAQGVFKRKQAKAPASRHPTGRKRARLGVVVFFVGVIMLYQAGLCSWTFLAKAVAAADARPRLQASTLRNLAEVRAKAPEDRSRFADDASYRAWEREWLRRTMAQDDGLEAWPATNRAARIEQLLDIHAREGAAGFARDGGLFRRVALPEAASARARVFHLYAVLMLLLLVSFGLMALGLQNQDLGQIEWNWLWLATLPLSTRTLFLGKLAEYTFLSAFFWMLGPVFFAVAGFVASRSVGAACAAAVVLSLALALLLASFRLGVETWARMRLSFQQRKNLQAVASVLGIGLLMGGYSTIFPMEGETLPGWFTAVANLLPQGGLLTGWAGAVLDPGCRNVPAGAAVLLFAAIVVAVTIGACTHLVRGGFETGLTSTPGRRAQSVRRVSWAGFDAAGRDLRVLMRDRALFVQTLILPVAVVGFNLTMNRGVFDGQVVWAQSRYVAAIAFGVGAYTLAVTATSVLAAEHTALWLLWSSPMPIARVLARKTVMWALLAMGFPVVVLIVGAFKHGFDEGFAPGHAVLALALTGVYAFIAAGVGATHTDPFAERPQQRVKQGAMLSYLFLLSLGSAAIAQPSAHVKIAFSLLALLLAWALWQRLRRRLPWLLDPVAGPPPELDLATAATAALGFLVLQSMLTLALLAAEMPVGSAVTISYGVSGVVVATATLAVLLLGKVPHVWTTVGLRPPPFQGQADAPAAGGLVLGAGVGLLAGAFGCGYLFLLRQSPWIRDLLAAQEVGMLPAGWAFVLLVVLAPLCEEFLFRGLLLTALRATVRPGVAILASATIFAMIHPTAGLPAVFGLGLATGWVFQRTGWLGPPMVAHALYNAVAFAMR